VEKILVTKTFLPPVEDYLAFVEKIFATGQLTNQGPMLKELEEKLAGYLGVSHFHFVSNGTIALQLAIDSLGIMGGEVITTPFSYVATASSILWQRCQPVFVDIEPNSFTIDCQKIEKAVSPATKAIMAVHVFGNACSVDGIQEIADRRQLKVIYDGAHAFGAQYQGRSLLDYGDVTTCSFHATKLFHTVEGGGCVVRDGPVSGKIELAKRFGHNYDEHLQLGINAKNSEIHAAMGLANFPFIESIIAARKQLSRLYDRLLPRLQKPIAKPLLQNNFAYYPVVFQSETQLLKVFSALNRESIFPRRYFYPSLNTIAYISGASCPLSEDISSRIACLPLYVHLMEETVEKICDIINVNI
jgi:dTDP-4-amino-4,6-dideoxygalactose transaminase